MYQRGGLLCSGDSRTLLGRVVVIKNSQNVLKMRCRGGKMRGNSQTYVATAKNGCLHANIAKEVVLNV